MEKKFYPEPTCYSCFDECKMVAMGMADPMQCDCLNNDNTPDTTTRRPITDIDIPEEQVRTMDSLQGCQIAKFDPFLSLDCARVEGVGAQSKERKGSNFAAQREP